jgi:hypothetical protein
MRSRESSTGHPFLVLPLAHRHHRAMRITRDFLGGRAYQHLFEPGHSAACQDDQVNMILLGTAHQLLNGMPHGNCSFLLSTSSYSACLVIVLKLAAKCPRASPQRRRNLDSGGRFRRAGHRKDQDFAVDRMRERKNATFPNGQQSCDKRQTDPQRSQYPNILHGLAHDLVWIVARNQDCRTRSASLARSHHLSRFKVGQRLGANSFARLVVHVESNLADRCNQSMIAALSYGNLQ